MRSGWRWQAALVLLAFVAYGNTLSYPLIYDDAELARVNPLTRRPAAIGSLLTTSFWGDQQPRPLYRPLTIWTFAANAGLNEVTGRDALSPVGFRLVNVLLHAGVGLALLSLLSGLGCSTPVAAAAAALFVVHPIHSEAVATVVGRAETMAALFGLLMLRWHHARRHWVLPGVAFLLALLSKESAVGFLALAVVIDLLGVHDRKLPMHAFAAYAAAAAAWGGLRAFALSGLQTVPTHFVDNPLAHAGVPGRVWSALSVQWRYLQLQVLPVAQSPDYSFAQVEPSALADLRACAFALIAATVAAGARKYRRSHPVLALCAAGYASAFAVTANILFPIGTIMAERLTYAPSLWTCSAAAVATGVFAVRSRRAWAAAAFSAVAVLVGCTISYNRVWAGELELAQAMVERAPRSARAHYGLGTVLAASRHDVAAIDAYRQALAILPSYSDAWFNLGNALRRSGAPVAEVASAYTNAVRHDPGTIKARANLALVLADVRPRDALLVVEELERLSPGHPAVATVRHRGKAALERSAR